jgi:TonB family protein
MKKILFFLFFSFSTVVFCQNEKKDTFVFVEEMPEFPGGEEGLNSFLVKTVVYPSRALEDDLQGKVYLSFVVDTFGNVYDAKIEKSVHPLLDNAALKVIDVMPKWKPGRQNGKAVRVRFNLPVVFELEEKKKKKKKKDR